ncbi:hypothetical protein E2C01_085010 [Portunus trituberculatus]|uniref:Uncharacterized protein n=1 Tax=Portunus trituberculatus TaxID=210409 RepID=A0A5B7J6A9_PORTR|nr:hypothetical protein [Portunus trituberculatus]
MRGSKPNIEIAEKGGEGGIEAAAAQQTDGSSPAVSCRCRLADEKCTRHALRFTPYRCAAPTRTAALPRYPDSGSRRFCISLPTVSLWICCDTPWLSRLSFGLLPHRFMLHACHVKKIMK